MHFVYTILIVYETRIPTSRWGGHEVQTFLEFRWRFITSPYSMTFCVVCICFYLNIVQVVLFFFLFFGSIDSEKTVNYNISEAGFSSPPLPPSFVWSLTSSPRGFGFYAQGDTCFHSFYSLIFIYFFPYSFNELLQVNQYTRDFGEHHGTSSCLYSWKGFLTVNM